MGRPKAFDADKAMDGAIDCFWARGYEAASVRDLADHMGIGGASLYNAFGGKRALFVAALERYANRSSRERIVRLEATGRPRQAIEAFLAEVIERSLKDPARKGCLFVNSALDVTPDDPELVEVVAGYLEEIRAFFQRNIEAGRRSGQMPRAIDPTEVSAHLLGVLLGIRVLARTRPERALLEGIARPALALLKKPRSGKARGDRK